MLTTVAHLSDRVEFLTSATTNESQIGPDFPINLLPADSICFTDESYELLKIPIAINYMLSAHLAVSINTELTTATG